MPTQRRTRSAAGHSTNPRRGPAGGCGEFDDCEAADAGGANSIGQLFLCCAGRLSGEDHLSGRPDAVRGSGLPALSGAGEQACVGETFLMRDAVLGGHAGTMEPGCDSY